MMKDLLLKAGNFVQVTTSNGGAPSDLPINILEEPCIVFQVRILKTKVELGQIPVLA